MKKLLIVLAWLLTLSVQAQIKFPVDASNSTVNINSNLSPSRAIRVSTDGTQRTYSSGVINFTPTANATDIAAFQLVDNNNAAAVKSVVITGYCSAGGASLDVLLQRSVNGGGGTSTIQPIARHDNNDVSPSGALAVYSSNRTSQGNGISNTRPIIRQGKLLLGTVNNPGTLRWVFADKADKGIVLRNLVEWLVLNLNGQSIPSGTVLGIDIEWTEERYKKVAFIGDSTTDLANFLFQYIWQHPKVNSTLDVRNYGSNGMRIVDILMNTNTPKYSLSTAIAPLAENYASIPDQVVFCGGINTVRTGQVTLPQLVSEIDATIYAIRNGAVAGQTYTSTKGAGTTFTWAQNVTGNSDTEIVLWGPNPLATDDPTSMSYVTATGVFTGMTIAQAAQAATDMMYNAYEAFRGDPRIKAVVQKQDIPEFGRISKPTAQMGTLIDPLHPNGRGQKLSAQQILPYILNSPDWLLLGLTISTGIGTGLRKRRKTYAVRNAKPSIRYRVAH